MEELLQMIQQDPELWELVEQLKHQDEDPSDFILNVAQMLAIEFEDLHRTDLNDKLDELFCDLHATAFEIEIMFLHIALDIFMMRATPTQNQGE